MIEVNADKILTVSGHLKEGMRNAFGAPMQSPGDTTLLSTEHHHGHGDDDHYGGEDHLGETSRELELADQGVTVQEDAPLPEVPMSIFSTEGIVGLTVAEQFANLPVLPAHHNIERLSAYGPKGFGLVIQGVGIVPAVVSPRSTPTELHLFYDEVDAIKPQQVGVEEYSIPEQRVNLLRNAVKFQDPTLGLEEADASAAPAVEPGHGLLGMRTLSSESVQQSVRLGKHVVHDLAESKSGILPAFSNDTQESYGMFSHPKAPVGLKEMIITANDKTILVLHGHYDVLDVPTELEREAEISPVDIVAGFALMAASSQQDRPVEVVTQQAIQNMELV